MRPGVKIFGGYLVILSCFGIIATGGRSAYSRIRELRLNAKHSATELGGIKYIVRNDYERISTDNKSGVEYIHQNIGSSRSVVIRQTINTRCITADPCYTVLNDDIKAELFDVKGDVKVIPPMDSFLLGTSPTISSAELAAYLPGWDEEGLRGLVFTLNKLKK